MNQVMSTNGLMMEFFDNPGKISIEGCYVVLPLFEQFSKADSSN